MTGRIMFLMVQTIALVLLTSIATVAQSQDRAKIEKEIEALREQLKQKEDELLAPSAEDRAQFAEFLLQPDTGLARLLPREKYREKLTLREGGAYYSFTRLSNSYDRDPQISLERDTLRTGFVGADFGFLASLGDIPIETVGLDHKGVQYLAAFAAPSVEPEAREQYHKNGVGFTVGGYLYKSSLPTMAAKTYILRSISYNRFDVLVAFRVVRLDPDGSLVLVWKRLKEFPTPILERH
ncbi:MAG TPA: hypothetical protein VI837_08620 [Blastocatellia bacterium]|nr:hypothetical protein [Blastocatellia bacterium]